MQDDPLSASAPAGERLAGVLDSALETFARYGYRRTSMEDVARDARISRPGLYLHFPSKLALLQAAVQHALSRAVVEAEARLAGAHAPLADRLMDALDTWAGPYTGPFATDLDRLLDQDAALLGDLPAVYAERFRAALAAALATATGPSGRALAPTPAEAGPTADVLLALVAGTKRQASDRADFRARLRRGLDLLVR